MKSKKKGCLLPLLFLAAVLVAGGAWLHSRGLGQLLSLWRLADQWTAAAEADFQVTMDAGDLHITANGWWTDSSNGRVYGFEAQNVPVYVMGETLVLDNGRAYTLPELPFTEKAVWEYALGVLLQGSVTTQDNAWHLYLPENGLGITASAQDQQLSRLELRGSIPLDGESLPLAITLTPVQTQHHNVSAEVLRALSAEGATPLMEPLEPLLPAVAAIGGQEAIGGDLTVAVDCGILQMDETFDAEYTAADGTLHLHRGGIHIPVELPALDEFLSPAVLPVILLRNGTFVQEADGWLCAVDVEPELTKELCVALIPELEDLDFESVRMRAEIQIQHDTFQSVMLTGSGEIPFLMTSIPITLTMTWDFA